VATLLEFLAKLDRGAWLRFFIALGGLALSFACAIFSTVLRESGFIIYSAVVASLALLTAGFVGLYSVPYLAKQVVRERWIDAFEYEITKEGIVYLAAVIVITIAALNTGNNLLFIIISAMLSAVVISGVASAFILRRLTIHLSIPDTVFAETPCIARLRLTNRRRIPIFSLHVSTPASEKGKLRWQRTAFHFPPFRESELAWFTIQDWRLKREGGDLSNESPLIAPLYFPLLSPNYSANADVEMTFPRRGVFRQRALAVATRFPFSFVKKTRHVSTAEEVIVLPALHPIDRLVAEMPALSGTFESTLRGHGYDLYRIRDHVPGESSRSVDWKATARSGSLMVREFTKDDERRVCIVFDNPAEGTLDEHKYEEMVSACASLAWYVEEQQVNLEFLAPDFEGTVLMEFLAYLAVVQPAQELSLRHVPELPYAAFSVVFTAGDWDRVVSNGNVFHFKRTTATAQAEQRI
jgi:hypothetical protein